MMGFTTSISKVLGSKAVQFKQQVHRIMKNIGGRGLMEHQVQLLSFVEKTWRLSAEQARARILCHE